jgi:hypothetical protein
MFLKDLFEGSKEPQKKNEYLCTTLLKDIRFDIGESFVDQEKKRLFTVSDLHITGNKQCIDLHLHLMEPLTIARQTEWTEETGKPLEIDDERMQEFYQRYYQEVEESVKRCFPYAVFIRHHITLSMKQSEKDKIDINYSIHIDIDERILPLSRKIKKSIIRFRDSFFART